MLLSPRIRTALGAGSLAVVLALAAGCGSDAGTAPAQGRSTPPTSTFRGTATIDGRPFDARWIGAVVLDHGLVTPCNRGLPRVRDGHFTLAVYRAAASAGCGRAGSTVAFWTYADDTKLYATAALPWRGGTSAHTARVTFSKTAPQGAVPPVMELNGHVLRSADTAVVHGRVEARVGTTVCGIASIRISPGYTGYIMSVVGPTTIPGCAADATIEFTVDGRAASPPTPNQPTQSRDHNLTAPGRPTRP